MTGKTKGADSPISERVGPVCPMFLRPPVVFRRAYLVVSANLYLLAILYRENPNLPNLREHQPMHMPVRKRLEPPCHLDGSKA